MSGAVTQLSIGTSAGSMAATIALGVFGAVIAVLQLVNALFLPRAVSLWEVSKKHPARNRRMIVIRIVNRGGASGLVESIDAVEPDHRFPQTKKFSDWTGATDPVPFVLPARSSAIIVIEPDGAERFTADRRILITYGNGKQQCIRMEDRENLMGNKTWIPS